MSSLSLPQAKSQWEGQQMSSVASPKASGTQGSSFLPCLAHVVCCSFSDEVAHVVRNTLDYKGYTGTAITGTLLQFAPGDDGRSHIGKRPPSIITQHTNGIPLPDIDGVQALLCRRNVDVSMDWVAVCPPRSLPPCMQILKLVDKMTQDGHGARLLCLGGREAGPLAAKRYGQC